MSEVTKVKPTIDTSLFAKILEESMGELKPGTPFVPTQVKLGRFYGEKNYDE
jgi:hypothetical protein